TTFNLINEYTSLIIHKKGVATGITDGLTGTQLAGAKLGIRLISRPDIPKTATEKTEKTEPKFSYEQNTGTTDITKNFLHAKIGDTVHTFTTSGSPEVIKGIPAGFIVEVYEIEAPAGYDFAIAIKTEISKTDTTEITLVDQKTAKVLAQTGQNTLVTIMLSVALLLMSMYFLLFIQKKKKHFR
ncbi:MAG: LPXTG cell wall anchor domain-containing protein, partial [Culicoidibacterales bacterium]